jgi:hypothetical protein
LSGGAYLHYRKQHSEPSNPSPALKHNFNPYTYDLTGIIDKILLVQLAVGSRFVEVIKVSDYFVASEHREEPEWKNEQVGKFDNAILIKGVAKSKNNDQQDGNVEAGKDDTEIVKPVAFKMSPLEIQYLVYEVIRPAIAQFIKNLEITDNKDYTAKFNLPALKRIRSFNGFDKEGFDTNRFGTHALRKIYANYSFDNYAVGVSRNAWITKVLGHEPSSVTTSLSYTTTAITQQLKFLDDDGLGVLIKDLQVQIKLLQENDKKRKLAEKRKHPEEEDRDSNVIGFITKEGGYVEFMTATPGGDRQAKCFAKMKELHNEDVKVTFEKMRRFGFGTEKITAAMQLYKDWKTLHEQALNFAMDPMD